MSWGWRVHLWTFFQWCKLWFELLEPFVEVVLAEHGPLADDFGAAWQLKPASSDVRASHVCFCFEMFTWGITMVYHQVEPIHVLFFFLCVCVFHGHVDSSCWRQLQAALAKKPQALRRCWGTCHIGHGRFMSFLLDWENGIMYRKWW